MTSDACHARNENAMLQRQTNSGEKRECRGDKTQWGKANSTRAARPLGKTPFCINVLNTKGESYGDPTGDEYVTPDNIQKVKLWQKT